MKGLSSKETRIGCPPDERVLLQLGEGEELLDGERPRAVQVELLEALPEAPDLLSVKLRTRHRQRGLVSHGGRVEGGGWRRRVEGAGGEGE